MPRRNLILLTIILTVAATVIFGFFYFSQIKTVDTGEENSTEGANFFANFLPFGGSKNTKPAETTPVDVSGYVPETGEELINVKLKRVSQFPVAGFGVFMKERFKDMPNQREPKEEAAESPLKPADMTIKSASAVPPTEFAPALRYVDKATGNIYQTFADRIDERKFSSTLIPRVYEAFFGNKGESVLLRYLKEDNKTIETFRGILPKEYLGADGGVSEIKGSFLPENIGDVSMSPDASKIFYLFKINDNIAGVTLSLPTNTKSQIFDSAFTEWLSLWPNSKMITMTTKPSGNIPGYMYTINPDNKSFNKIMGGINGLTTLTSPNGKMVLHGDNRLSLNIFDINTGNSRPVSVETLPEKCVWSSTSDTIYCAVPKSIDQGMLYPDSWYQGEVSFSDEIWKIDIQNGNSIMILDPVSAGRAENIDGVKLSLDENQNYLFFLNKKDSLLWELNLK